MIDLLLNPTFLNAALLIAAVATPLLAVVALKARPHAFHRRTTLLFGALGPAAGLLWLFHNVVLESVGFDNILSALIVMGTALALGISAGWWAAGEKSL